MAAPGWLSQWSMTFDFGVVGSSAAVSVEITLKNKIFKKLKNRLLE